MTANELDLSKVISCFVEPIGNNICKKSPTQIIDWQEHKWDISLKQAYHSNIDILNKQMKPNTNNKEFQWQNFDRSIDRHKKGAAFGFAILQSPPIKTPVPYQQNNTYNLYEFHPNEILAFHTALQIVLHLAGTTQEKREWRRQNIFFPEASDRMYTAHIYKAFFHIKTNVYKQDLLMLSNLLFLLESHHLALKDSTA